MRVAGVPQALWRWVVVIDAEDYNRLFKPAPEMPLVRFLEGLELDVFDLTRDPDHGREPEL